MLCAVGIARPGAKHRWMIRLAWLDGVIKESMLLCPSAWTQGVQAVEALGLDGYHFPAGILLIDLYVKKTRLRQAPLKSYGACLSLVVARPIEEAGLGIKPKLAG